MALKQVERPFDLGELKGLFEKYGKKSVEKDW